MLVAKRRTFCMPARLIASSTKVLPLNSVLGAAFLGLSKPHQNPGAAKTSPTIKSHRALQMKEKNE
jgi:hypothetical protein